jgi:tetratricopeptide (TPR) repeat protein
MQRLSVLVLNAFVAGMVFFTPVSSFGQHISTDSERWDLLMIKEARIWKNLLINYAYAEHQRYWPERNAALKKIVHEFADSRWADDAALILACGKASFENNASGAIADLKKVAEQYTNAHTVVSHWDPHDGCRLDDTWLMWQGGLVFLKPDGTIRIAKPFDRDGKMSQLEREGLAYFEHLERYPRATKVMAQLFISEMLGQKGDRAGAIAVLEKIVSNSASYLALVSKGDRIGASKPDGYYIRTLVGRPEYRAYLSLIGYYEKQEEIDKAREMADTLLKLCSKDGWLWTINRHIGNFFGRHGLRSQAKEQYQLALTGLSKYRDDTEKRSKFVGGSDIPDNFWEDSRRELEEKLIEEKR